MRIIAVNISQLYEKLGALRATERAWKINVAKLRKNPPDFVIGVKAGEIRGHFKLKNIASDTEPQRVKFSLDECTKKEKSVIDTFVKGKNLRYFTIKQNW